MASVSSLKFQIKLALGLAAWGKNTLPQTFDENEMEEKLACLEMCLLFLTQARALSRHKLIVELLKERIIGKTMDTYYREEEPGANQALLDALDKLYQACVSMRWIGTGKHSPITPSLRQHVRKFENSKDL
jgi:hypothetical protein